MAKKKKKEAKKIGKPAKKKAVKKAAKKVVGKSPKKAPKKPAGKSPKKAPRKAVKKPSKQKAAKTNKVAPRAKGTASSVPAKGAAAPLLPGMGEGIETEEFEPEVGLVADDEDDEEVDFPENEEIVATPDLEKHGDDDEGEW